MHFIEFTRKDTGKPCIIQLEEILTFNADVDGCGTMIVLSAGTVRPVKECYDKVIKIIQRHLNHK